MKRTLMATLVALAIAGAASAQNANPPAKGPDGQQQPQQTTISGKLEWLDGMIGLKSGENVYYAPQVKELVGFVKDLQEGATVSLTGFARKIPYSQNSFFRATKLSFNGKDYEFGQDFGPAGREPGMGMGMRREEMRGSCSGEGSWGMMGQGMDREPRW